MPFDPNNEKDFKRLRDSVKHNYERMECFRDVREACVDAARGHYYDCEETKQEFDRPNSINSMDQWHNNLVRSFVQDTPRVRVTNKDDPRVAQIFQQHLNQVGVEIDIAETFKNCIRESLLGYLGTAYVGIADDPDVPDGASFVDSIGLPDRVLDMARNTFGEGDFEGHRYERRIDELRDSGMYNLSKIDDIELKHTAWLQTQHDEKHLDDMHSVYEWITLWRIHVKPSNLIVTFADVEGVESPLRVASFDGPTWGSYIRLGFDNVLDGLLPNSRGAMILDIHNFINMQYQRIFIKEDQSAEIFTYHGGAEDDANAIREAADGEMVQVNDNSAVQRRRKGGTNPQALGTAIHARQLFDDQSGHVRQMGPIADTARAESLIQQNISRLVKDMQNTFRAFAQKVYQSIAWYEWTNPARSRKVEIKRGKNGKALEDMWSPEIRQGDFARFEIKIVPESFEFRSSEEQAARVMRAMQGVVIPAMQLPSRKPVVLDSPGFVKRYAELEGIDDELSQFVDFSETAVPNAGGQARIPAGATVGGPQNGGLRPAPQEDLEQRVLAQAMSGGNQQQEGDEF